MDTQFNDPRQVEGEADLRTAERVHSLCPRLCRTRSGTYNKHTSLNGETSHAVVNSVIATKLHHYVILYQTESLE